MCSLLKKEIEKHLLLYGVVYVIEPTGALILADGRSCTVSDYKVIPETVHIKNGAFLNCTIIESVDMSTSQVNSIGHTLLRVYRKHWGVGFQQMPTEKNGFAGWPEKHRCRCFRDKC